MPKTSTQSRSSQYDAIYVVIVVNEDDDEDDKGGCRGLGEDGDYVCDCRGNRRRGVSVDAGGGAGGGAAGRALFCGLIGAAGKRRHQPGATHPPNALVLLSVLVMSGSLSSMVRTLMWTSTWILSQSCDVPPS
jgi:hypothetical protein